MDLYQVVLPSGTGVRFRLLTPVEHDAALTDAATAAGVGATVLAIRTSQMRESLKRMLHSCTRKKVASMEELAQLKDTDWVPLNQGLLQLPGEFQYDKLFSSKDDGALGMLYSRYHELTRDEAEAIVGKVQPVSVG